MHPVDILILLLEDGDPTSALNRIDEALFKLAEISDIKERQWMIRINDQTITIRVETRGTLESISTVLTPTTQEEYEDRARFDIILLDNGWDKCGGSDREGLNQLIKAKWSSQHGPLLALFTEHAQFKFQYVAEALAAGASALIWKSETTHLVNLLYFAVQRKTWREQMRRSQREVSAILNDPHWASRIVADSMAMQSTLRDIVAIAGFDNLPIVFEGPVGSGKTLLAELSHSLSRRSRGPFVSAYLNQCAPEMVAAELFGVTKGAATGVDRRKGLIASAEGGTLFIDELQALSLEHQEVIKNVIERRQYRPIGSDGPEIACNVRFILATNEPIDQLISNGRMRRDFARRIDVASIRVPALSERVEDIPGLANAAVDRWCADAGQQGARPKVPPETLNYLLSASFQDNVAGLLNKVTRACLRAGEALELRPEHF